jgi:uncharacterized membrane protein YhaH (DUF805 family)
MTRGNADRNVKSATLAAHVHVTIRIWRVGAICAQICPREQKGSPAMPISQLLFSFRGRLNRQHYWLTSIAILLLIVVLVAVVFTLMDVSLVLLVVLGLLYIPLLWIAFALGAKRLHDRDKSAWWLLLFYVLPSILSNLSDQAGGLGILLLLIGLALSIWAFVELGCLRGTVGPNRFGPDPLQAPSVKATAAA